MTDRSPLSRLSLFTGVFAALALWSFNPAGGRVLAQRPATAFEFNDSHFHLTNYIQEGIDVRRYLEIG